jgi:leucyl aminopeptidase
MYLIHADSLKVRKRADMVVVPFWKGKKGAEPAADFDFPQMAHPLKTADFSGKEGEVLILYQNGLLEPRLALLGLGAQDKVTVEKLRRAYAQVTKACRPRKIKSLNVLLPIFSSLTEEAIARGLIEGLLLSNYVFDQLKRDSLKENEGVLLEKIALVGISKKAFAIAEKCKAICQAVYFVRDLVNGNADDVTPQYLSKVALNIAKEFPKVKTTVFDKKRIESEKLGLLLTVNRGSFRDPAFIIIEYRGQPKSSDRTVLVGKGITFDTGGLNQKATGGMETMRDDMAGAAAVLGIIRAAASLGLPQNIVGVIASTENSIGSKSFKPGDVYVGYAGKTVEIGNTDAEGRLVLADALAYAERKLKPTRLIDLATLTGAADIALGSEISILFSNNDALADSLIRAGSETFERVWRLPLHEEYKEQLKSDIADIKSTGGRSASCITASLFLQEFVKKIPWAHFDIGATAFSSEAKRYSPKYATGVGIRLMIEYLEHL